MEFESTLFEGLRVRGDSADGTATLRLRGFVDMSTCDHLYECGEAYLKEGATSLVIEASDLSFIDSSGISTILRLQQRAEAEGGSLTIANPSEVLVRLMAVLAIDDILELDLDLA